MQTRIQLRVALGPVGIPLCLSTALSPRGALWLQTACDMRVSSYSPGCQESHGGLPGLHQHGGQALGATRAQGVFLLLPSS